MQEHILIIGSGGREYALGRALAQDKRVKKIFFAPGNAATTTLGTNLPHTTQEQILNAIHTHHISLVIIGPEQPISEGMGDFLRTNGVRVFAPSKLAARLEGSKAFMKDFVSSLQIPTARYLQTDNLKKICDFIDTLTPPIVLKADGLCGGKGVIIAKSIKEAKSVANDMLSGSAFGEAGRRIVVEEFLDGYELSIFAICDGEDFILLPPCQDHKRLYDNDEGLNTGGMGAYTPTPLCDENLLNKIAMRIIAPTLKACKERGFAFEGVLFAGIMVVDSAKSLESADSKALLRPTSEPYLLEFNVRFGDPECEVLMPLLETPLLDVINASVDKKLKHFQCAFKQQFAVGVVAASAGYPTHSSAPQPISIEAFNENLGHIVYAGVSADSKGKLHSSGGRVLLCVGVGETLIKAKRNAYEIMKCVHFEGMHFRNDIADKAL